MSYFDVVVVGAAPLKRHIQREVETALTCKLIAGDISDHCPIKNNQQKNRLIFQTTNQQNP